MKEIAEALFISGAVHLATNSLAELQAPIYCDVRAALGSVAARTLITNSLADRIAVEFPGCGALVGVATGGVAFAAIAAQMLGLPCGYVRVREKDRGLGRFVEGNLKVGISCVIIEDCMALGNSAARAVIAARDYGCIILGIISVVAFESCSAERTMGELGVKTLSLTCIDELVGVGLENGSITGLLAECIRKYAKGQERKQ